MAKETKHISVKPSEAQGGGTIGIPAGATFEITEAQWTRWEEAGESAIKKGRAPEDPALKIVADVEGADDPVTEFLSAGKATRMEPSRDGDYLDPVEGSGAEALNPGCNAHVFLASIFTNGSKKDDAYKRHKSDALDEGTLDDGISGAVVGLKGIAGRIKIDRESLDAGRPTLVVDEILEAPGSGKSKSKSKAKAKDEDEGPAKSKGKSTDDGFESKAEKGIVEALASPKYRKGIPLDKAWTALFNAVKEDDDARKIAAYAEDEKWLKDEDRPWTYDKGENTIVEA